MAVPNDFLVFASGSIVFHLSFQVIEVRESYWTSGYILFPASVVISCAIYFMFKGDVIIS